jgi:hypothetical protein
LAETDCDAQNSEALLVMALQPVMTLGDQV